MNKEQRLSLAFEKFLDSNPAIKSEIEALSEVDAEHVGISLEDYQKAEVAAKFAAYAASQGIDPYELTVNLTADSADEKARLMEESHKKIADAIGVTWDKYLEINPHLRR